MSSDGEVSVTIQNRMARTHADGHRLEQREDPLTDDALLNIVGMRAIRTYADRPVADEIVQRILEAGRSSGSSRNRQPWIFYVAHTEPILSRMAPLVFAPENVKGCRLAVAIASAKGGFDIGRCAERMMLAAWAYGVGSVPNGIKDAGSLAEMLGLDNGVSVTTILTFGYPLRAPRQRPVEELLPRMSRLPMAEIVRYLD